MLVTRKCGKFIYGIFFLFRYDALSACLVDFKGRASIASVKNFQMIKSEPMSSKSSGASAMAPADPSTISVQMGKVNLCRPVEGFISLFELTSFLADYKRCV